MKYFKIISVLLLFTVASQAQELKPPFRDEIKEFKKQDSLSFPQKNAILFVGSSSFRLWTNLDSFFPGYKIINRGFGGSSLPDVIRYADDIIFPYRPKQVVIYCGENDLAASDTVTGEMVFQRFKQLFNLVRKKLPDTEVLFVAMKPSPSRWYLKEKMMKGNELISEYLKKQKNTSFADVWPAMLKPDGMPMDDIFREDQLHMTSKGYDIWKRVIGPYLIK